MTGSVCAPHLARAGALHTSGCAVRRPTAYTPIQRFRRSGRATSRFQDGRLSGATGALLEERYDPQIAIR